MPLLAYKQKKGVGSIKACAVNERAYFSLYAAANRARINTIATARHNQSDSDVFLAANAGPRAAAAWPGDISLLSPCGRARGTAHFVSMNTTLCKDFMHSQNRTLDVCVCVWRGFFF